jgi:hypothetical protein
MAIWNRGTFLTVSGSGIFAVAMACCTDRLASVPSADVTRGSEEAFSSSGLYERERAPDGKPLRWMRAQATAVFSRLPRGHGVLSVELLGHKSAVRVLVGGSILGALAPGVRSASWPIELRNHALEVGIDVEPFRASDGRLLGTQLRRITFTPLDHSLLPGVSLLLLFVLPAVALALLARVSGCGPGASLSLTAASIGLAGLLLMHCGVLHSAYAVQVVGALVVGGVVGLALAKALARRLPSVGPFAFAAALAAAFVQLVLAPSSIMVASDVVLQAHILEHVARGDLFPTSVTQHAVPFRIPYGVSFFALLAPLQRLGLDAVSLVRWGAGIAGFFAALALFVMLAPRSPRLAAGTVIGLQLLPGTFLPYSQGNLPNVFGQALTTIFFAWWAGSAPVGWAVGAILFALAGIGHLSAALVLAVFALFLAVVGRADAREARWRRGVALAVGAGAVALYYAAFTRLIARQVPRLLEGAGQGAGHGPATAFESLLKGVAQEWLGVPALLLALIGWWSFKDDRLARAIKAFVLAGAALMLVGLVSPVEVRYLYALTTPIAILAAVGAERLWSLGLPARLSLIVLAGLQAMLAGTSLIDRLLFHYR